jgi:carboxypeptidase Taq
MAPRTAYDELVKLAEEAALLGSVGELLEWDQHAVMPPAGAGHRSEQISLVAGLRHKRFTDPRVGELLSAIEGSELSIGDTPEAADIRELRCAYDKAVKLPARLVEELARTTSLAQEEWVSARRGSDFSKFLPWLERILKLVREKAQAYGPKGEAYDALLDDFEPGARAAEVSAVFSALREDLIRLLDKVRGAPRQPKASALDGDFDPAVQKLFAESVIGAMGFDFDSGRLDKTAHPFCVGIGAGDTRILTRYNPKRLTDALLASMHEAGHALYEMGLDKQARFGRPSAEAVSLGIHESQSRIWENQVGRSRAFWEHFFPQARRLFRASLGAVSLDDFYGAVNEVKPSYIRVEADEAYYNLHILLRFELERALLSGDLKPADVPAVWNARFKKYFGVAVDKDSNGCLQDVHWAAGLIGYFPTYTLGNLYAAQFFAKANADMPDLSERISRGDLSGLRGWLKEGIHRHGKLWRAGVLCQRVTGAPLSHKPLIEYMSAKYGEIYGF